MTIQSDTMSPHIEFIRQIDYSKLVTPRSSHPRKQDGIPYTRIYTMKGEGGWS